MSPGISLDAKLRHVPLERSHALASDAFLARVLARRQKQDRYPGRTESGMGGGGWLHTVAVVDRADEFAAQDRSDPAILLPHRRPVGVG